MGIPRPFPGISLFPLSLTAVFGSQGAQMKMELASLAPLQVPRVAVARDRPGEGLPTQSLYRKTTQLLETLYQLSANAKVVDMRQSKSSRSYIKFLGVGGGLWHLCVVLLPTEGLAAMFRFGGFGLRGTVLCPALSPSGPLCVGGVGQCSGAQPLPAGEPPKTSEPPWY